VYVWYVNMCISLRSNEINYMSEVKFLRMCITENLGWQAHICSLCHSLSEIFFKLLNPLKPF
jgi:hypothetical protein